MGDVQPVQEAALLMWLIMISAHLQMICQMRRATATQCSPVSAWAGEQRRNLHRLVGSRPEMLMRIQRGRDFGAHELEIICGARSTAHSRGAPSTTPATCHLDTSCGSAVAPCRCLGRQSGIDLRVWYRNWTASSQISLLHKWSAPSLICSSHKTQ